MCLISCYLCNLLYAHSLASLVTFAVLLLIRSLRSLLCYSMSLYYWFSCYNSDIARFTRCITAHIRSFRSLCSLHFADLPLIRSFHSLYWMKQHPFASLTSVHVLLPVGIGRLGAVAPFTGSRSSGPCASNSSQGRSVPGWGPI